MRAEIPGTFRAMTAAALPSSVPASPRVSIVIPAYNSAAFLRRTLDGVFAQSFSEWELVIYDDGSSDDTVRLCEAVADGDDRVRVVRGTNGGVASARNRGFAATTPTSEFVIFLDHDDLWEPEMLGTLVEILDAEPRYVSAHTTARGLDEAGQRLPDDDLADPHRRPVRLPWSPRGPRAGLRPDDLRRPRVRQLDRDPGSAPHAPDLARAGRRIRPRDRSV